MAEINIIIPHYNHSKALEQCLQSILKQTFQDFEIIIIDDGSCDFEKGELARITQPHRNYQEAAIKVFYEDHKGANAARNRGAREARGNFFLFCDADVIMSPEMLFCMRECLQKNSNAAYAYSSFKFGWKLFRLWPFDLEKLRENNYIHTTSLIRRQYFPWFDEIITRLQDWDLWLTISERGGAGVWIPKILFTVIPRNKGMSKWLPRFMYRIPWERFGIRIQNLFAFNQAKEIIKQKHHL